MEGDHDNDNDNGSTSPREGEPLIDEALVLPHGSTNTARARPKHIPKHTSENYIGWKAQHNVALHIAARHKEEELWGHTDTGHISIGENGMLTMHPRDSSQSKLSQQELSDLQRATHFDKKELQQWYKGRSCYSVFLYPTDILRQLPFLQGHMC